MTNILNTKEFENEIKMGIPIDQVPHPPKLDEHIGKVFLCGSGNEYLFDLIETPVFLDMGMFKVCVIVKESNFMNVLKLRSMFSSNIKTLSSCKLEIDKSRYGFTLEYPEFDQVINRLGIL